MSYAQRKEISGNRTVAIVIVALIHALLGYAFVTGLAYNVIKKAADDLKTFDVEEEPPPPEEEPPPPPDMPDVPPPPMMPPPVMRPPVQQQPIRVIESPYIPPAPPIIQPRPVPPAPPRPPAPPPVKTVPPRSASGNLQGLISADDYPSQAISNDEQGTVTVSLSIGTSGRVTGCSTTASSGSRTLDSATCRILTSRARFTPARDNQGNPATGTFSQRITWRLE